MNDHEQSDRVRPGRALWALALLFGGALLLGLLLAPPVFNGLLYLGRTVEGFQELRNLEFEQVANRCVLALVVLGLWPAIRFAGIRPDSLGFRKENRWPAFCLYGWLAGVLSILIWYAAGWGLGAYSWAPRADVNLAVRVLGFLVGGWVVGLIEETLFRGWMFGMMKRITGFLAAALVSSILFSAVHFIDPEPPLGIVHASWHTGFSLLPHAFALGGPWSDYFPYALNLFLMGWILCALMERFGHIYFIIGLHAGWVVVLQAGRYFWSRDPDAWVGLFGGDVGLAHTPAVLALACLWLAGVVLLLRKRENGG